MWWDKQAYREAHEEDEAVEQRGVVVLVCQHGFAGREQEAAGQAAGEACTQGVNWSVCMGKAQLH